MWICTQVEMHATIGFPIGFDHTLGLVVAILAVPLRCQSPPEMELPCSSRTRRMKYTSPDPVPMPGMRSELQLAHKG